jgi:formate-dependent nitrite reductase membrane component NrfD
MSRMATRQWMTTHEWMVKPMHQREWIERRGIMIWIAETFTSLGAGLYLVSLFVNSWWGLLFGWIIIMFIKLPIHLAYFGKPWRFYRTIPPWSNAWKTSWFARGILFSIFFGMFGFVQLVFGQPDFVNLVGANICNPIYYTFGVLAGLNALGVGIYGGFIMNYVKGIPFWNQGLLPIVIMLAGVADGFGLIMAVALAGGDASVVWAETGSRYLLLINVLLIVTYLISAGYTSETAKLSIKELLAGPSAFMFWGGLVVLGLAVPAAISVYGLIEGGEAVTPLLITAITAHTIGAFALKYCILKVGIYRPLLPKTAPF